MAGYASRENVTHLPPAASDKRKKPKAARKDAPSGMALDHDVAIPKNFPLKLKKKPSA